MEEEIEIEEIIEIETPTPEDDPQEVVD